MTVEYTDKSGKIVAWVKDNQLLRADETVVGTIDPVSGDVIDPETKEAIGFLAHEGIYKGTRQAPVAWLKNSEFSE